MNILNNDKSALVTVDLYRVNLSVNVYTQHTLSQYEYFEDPLTKEEDLNDEDIVNLEEANFISKLYDEVLRGILK